MFYSPTLFVPFLFLWLLLASYVKARLPKHWDPSPFPNTMLLDPVAAYAIKTLDVADEGKVFINVCTDQQVPPPGTLDASEIAMQVMKGKDWVVPIVVSSGRSSADKSGQPCFVADCCMNPAVVMLGIEDPSVKVLTVETCIELVEDRFSKQLSRDYKFPRMKSKGPLERVEVDESQAFSTGAGAGAGADGSGGGVQAPQTTAGAINELTKELDKTTNDTYMDVEPTETKKIEVVESSEPPNPFYFHRYRGNYSGPGKKPSHVVELEGEHHNVKLEGSIMSNGPAKLELPFVPSMVDAFYCMEDDTTYVMLTPP